MRNELHPMKMTDRQLWSRAYKLILIARPLHNHGPKDLDATLYELDAVLQELQLRGQQLTLALPLEERPQRETPRGIRHPK